MIRFVKPIKEIFDKISTTVILGIGKVHWKSTKEISEDDKAKIRELLINDYYIILTRRTNHLSTFFVGLSNFVLTGKWGYWSHSLMNTEDEVKDNRDFRLIEAVGSGTRYTPFDDVFNVQSVALLKPKNMSVEQWTYILEKANSQLGKPYDTLFDLRSDSALSCVELVRIALQAEPDYDVNFVNFEKMIVERKNLTPQMFYDCPDFSVVFETRK